MKKLLTLICCFVSFAARSQIISQLTFDEGDTLFNHFVAIDTNNCHHNIWQVGAPHKPIFSSAYSAPNVIITDTANLYPTNDTSIFVLRVAKFLPTAPGSSWLAPLNAFGFWYQLNADSNQIARLEISEDSGLHWIDIMDSLPSGYSWPWGGAPQYIVPTTGWTFFSLQRDGYGGVNDSTLFRFSFISDSNTLVKEGWMIDNIEFKYYPEGIPSIQNDNLISVYPNPTKGKIYVHSSKTSPINTTISVYNMQGKEVYKTNKVTQNCYLDLPLPQGLYTLRYTQGNEYCVKKILIEK